MITLQTILQRSPKAAPIAEPTRLLGIDPGGTTGWAVIDYDPSTFQVEIVVADQFKSTFSGLDNIFELWEPDIVVVEAFRLYPWKAADQSFSDLQTPRFIGAIEYVMWKNDKWIAFQGAGQGKGFVKNDKLKQWGLYQAAKRHSNDAIRHICQYLIFGRDIELKKIDGNDYHAGE